jgi:hypothetical protein
MKDFRLIYRTALCVSASLAMISPRSAQSQHAALPEIGKDSVVVVAGPDFAAGGFHRSLLGDNYRDVWTTPIKVPILDLHSYDGGIKPLKEGGGMQTKSLRFTTADSTEWVFRSVHKSVGVLSKQFEGTIIWYIFRDAGSASHPTGALAAAPMMDAAGILHPTARLAVMPDDPILGEFRKDFAGMLGEIERHPTVPKDAPAFAGADKIIDAEELLKKINSSPLDQEIGRASCRERV